MCAPALAAVAALSTAAQLYSQQQQSQAAKKSAQASAENARQSYVNQMTQLQIRQLQESEATRQQRDTNNKEALKAQGTATAAAAERGASGYSVDTLLADYEKQRLAYDSNAVTNQEWSRLNYNEQAKSLQATAENRVVAARQQITSSQPNYLGTALNGAKDIYSIGDKAKWWE